MSDDAESKNADKALRDEIELRAYLKYCERGYIDGLDVENWLAAEREVLAERAQATRDAASSTNVAGEGNERAKLHPRSRRGALRV
jgi:hypothetical protein